jgi:SAM-dependent methyltransferase
MTTEARAFRTSAQADWPEQRSPIAGQPAWLSELILCPRCGQASLVPSTNHLECRKCGADYPVREGVVTLFSPEMAEVFAHQQAAWQARAGACGQYDIHVDETLLPKNANVRAQLEWLKGSLRRRGKCRILEIGAGRAWASRILAADGHEIVASDILDDPRIGLGCAARQMSRIRGSFACVLAGAERLPFLSESVDCIFCCATLRHIADLQRVLLEVSRLLRPDGVFVALDELFRGVLTTQAQRLQSCMTHRLARTWLTGNLPLTANEALCCIRASLGAELHEICRRVPFCLAAAEEAGLHATVLPGKVLAAMPPEFLDGGGTDRADATWIEMFAEAHGLSAEQLHRGAVNLWPLLREYWRGISNLDGALLAWKKNGREQISSVDQAFDMNVLRRMEPFLLGCGRDGIVPVYGFYPREESQAGAYYWLQPQAGFLIANTGFLELTISGPPACFRTEPVRIELRLEDRQTPFLVVAANPGKTVRLKAPLPGRATLRQSVLVRLNANVAFVPSDYDPRQYTDNRLLAVQLTPH